VCAVTGANSGLGLATAHALAARGATLLLLCRSAERGAAAVEAVKAASGNPDVHLEVRGCLGGKGVCYGAAVVGWERSWWLGWGEGFLLGRSSCGREEGETRGGGKQRRGVVAAARGSVVWRAVSAISGCIYCCIRPGFGALAGQLPLHTRSVPGLFLSAPNAYTPLKHTHLLTCPPPPLHLPPPPRWWMCPPCPPSAPSPPPSWPRAPPCTCWSTTLGHWWVGAGGGGERTRVPEGT
jgi:hypothetical protein